MKIHDVEQGTEEWFALRAGIPTASELKDVVTSEGKPSSRLSTYAAQLAAEAFAGKPLERWEGNQWSRRGSELEAEAISAYEFLRDATAERVGFVTNRAGSVDVGCSPDALLGTSDGPGLLEVKCLSPKHHVLALAYWHKRRACPPDYVAQVQGQMLVCEREWVDLWFYHPDLVSHAVRVHRDDAFLRALIVGLEVVKAERDSLLQVLAQLGPSDTKPATASPRKRKAIVVASVTRDEDGRGWLVVDNGGAGWLTRSKALAQDLEAAGAFGSPVTIDWREEAGARVIVGAKAPK